MNELTPRAKQYLRSLRLVSMSTADPAGLGLAKTAAPSTAEEVELECALVEAVMYKLAAMQTTSLETAETYLERGKAARDVVAASGEQRDAQQALDAWEALAQTEQVMQSFRVGNSVSDLLDRLRKPTD